MTRLILISIPCFALLLFFGRAILASIKEGKISRTAPALAWERRRDPLIFWSFLALFGLIVALAATVLGRATAVFLARIPTVQEFALRQWSAAAQKCSDSLDRPDVAIKLCTQALDSRELSNLNRALTFSNRGQAYEGKGDHARAIHDYDAALELEPNLMIALANRGVAYARKGDFDRALRDCDEAIRLQPDNAALFNGRGVVYLLKGDYDRAIEDHDRALQLAPNFSLALSNRGAAYVAKGEYDRAAQDYERSLRLDPNNAEAFYGRGYLYHSKGEYDRGIQDYDAALRLDPDNAAIYVDRGLAYVRKKNYDRAIQDYDAAIRLNPRIALAFSRRGGAYFRKGDLARAIQDYDEAINIDPNNAQAFSGKGRALFYLGRLGDARAAFATAVKVAPKDMYNALWLYLARSRAGQNGKEELAANAKNLDANEWPRPIVQLYLGAVTPKNVLASAADSDPKKNRERNCEAYFYLGEQALIRGDRQEAIRLFQATLETDVTNFIEYQAAQAELKRLAP
jgi:lipoprotein NlpI